jgi:hypothetical protein
VQRLGTSRPQDITGREGLHRRAWGPPRVTRGTSSTATCVKRGGVRGGGVVTWHEGRGGAW